jgi:integrative and conjugative element protein (TIGR02256 family)
VGRASGLPNVLSCEPDALIRYVIQPGGPGILVADRVLATLLRHRQSTPGAMEAGGQLFARFDGTETNVVEATGPTPFDHRGRFFFHPSRLFQRLEIRNCYKKGLHFVGDWHTHPQSYPRPSSEDRKSIHDCFLKSRHDLLAFVLIVVGTADPPSGLHVGLYDGCTETILVPEPNWLSKGSPDAVGVCRQRDPRGA